MSGSTENFWLPSLDQTGGSPEGGDLDREHRNLAAGWLRQRSTGVPGIVVANTKDGIGKYSVFDRFQHHSPTSRTRLDRGGPVLALYPDVQTLRVAERLADEALCVLGGYNTNLDYWILDRRAEPLTDYVVEQLPPLDNEVLSALDGAIFFGGNNSFSGPHEKRRARAAIKEIRRLAGVPTADQIQSYLVKANLSHKGVKWFSNEYADR